jgi:serine/threonine protein kinase
MRVPERVGDESGYYEVGELLGSGAMGAVHAAHDATGRQLAIKFLHEHLGDDPRIVERFAREARLARRVRSPHVARVLAAGQNGGLFWIAYERLLGETLEQRLQRLRVLPVTFVRAVLDQLLSGLEAAHNAGVIHRDIKPANVFLQRFETGESACILDFGISKSGPPAGSSTSQASLTSTTETLGTSNYMAPEQIDGAASVGPRADLYAAGVVGFRALTGRLPFVEATPTAVLYAKRYGQPRTLAQATGETWLTGIEAHFRRALAREPDDRFADAESMREAWDEATKGDAFPSLDLLRARAPEPEP